MGPVGIAAAVLALVLVGFAARSWWISRQVEKQVPPRGSFIEISTGRLHHIDCGRGPVVVLIHGLGGNLGNFDLGLIDELARDHRVIAIDRPGSGYSDRTDDIPANVRAQAVQVREALNALKIRRPLVVGHSLGGAVALALAADFGDDLRGLALISPLTLPVRDPSPAFKAYEIQSPLLRRIVAWVFWVTMARSKPEILSDVVFGPEAIPPEYATRGGGLLALRPWNFLQTSRDYQASGRDLRGLAERYGDFTIPVRILYGEDDHLLDPALHGDTLIARVPQFGLVKVPGGHMLPLTQPLRCADFIRRASLAMK